MRRINLELKDQVLPADLEEANRLMVWGSYCIAQMNYCLNRFNFDDTSDWTLEYQRSVNDLKHLQFKKFESERIDFDEKNYTFGN